MAYLNFRCYNRSFMYNKTRASVKLYMVLNLLSFWRKEFLSYVCYCYKNKPTSALHRNEWFYFMAFQKASLTAASPAL